MPTHNSTRSVAVWGKKVSRMCLNDIHKTNICHFSFKLPQYTSINTVINFTGKIQRDRHLRLDEDFHALHSQFFNFYPYQCIQCIHVNFPLKLHWHCSAVVSRMWDTTCLEHLSFGLHHFPCSSSQHVPDISLLLQTGVSQPDLHTTPTTQTPGGTTSPHTSSIFHSRMKYAWMCARHLPSLGLCSPQEARLICNWEVCWINQQFIHFLIEITLSKKTLITQNSTADPSRIVLCLLSMLTNGPLRFIEKLQWWRETERATKEKNIWLCRRNIVWLLHGEFLWCFDFDVFNVLLFVGDFCWFLIMPPLSLKC